MKTTIQISSEVRDAVKACRIYPRESYEEVLKRLAKEGMKDVRCINIQKALEEVKDEGREN